MKAWRSRGFVQDSEDEDERSEESQSSETNDDELVLAIAGRDDNETAVRLKGNCEPVVAAGTRNVQEQVEKAIEPGEAVNSEDEDELAIGWPQAKAAQSKSGGPPANLRRGDGVSHSGTIQRLGSSPPTSSLPETRELLRGHEHHTRSEALPQLPSGILITSTAGRDLQSSQLTRPSVIASGIEAVDTVETAGQGEVNVDEVSIRHWAAPQRNFRQRKPIQLNPYQILDGQYLQEMRRHGVRPTRVIVPPASRHDQDEASESDQSDGADSQSVYASPLRPRPHAHSADYPESPQVPLRTAHLPYQSSSPVDVSLDEDGLPVIDELLRHRASKRQINFSSKRRKLLHHDTSLRKKVEPVMRQTTDSRTPLSPDSSSPTSPDLPRATVRTEFRFPPPAVSPAKPPTPATSSSALRNRSNDHVFIRAISSPAQDLDALNRTGYEPMVILNGEVTEAEDTDEPNVEDDTNLEGLQVIQRRIKGVLPASWLKLDVKAQQKIPASKSDRRWHKEHRSDVQHTGVARRLHRTSKTAQRIDNLLTFSSDEELKNGTPAATLPLHRMKEQESRLTQSTRLSSLFQDDDPGEMMEDNAIDFMLPSLSRAKQTKRSKTRKYQTRVTDTFPTMMKQPKAEEGRKRSSNRKANQSNRLQPPRLSILDANAHNSGIAETVPTFLTIARRQAKRLPDHARHRPIGKALRLQTREDTLDVQSVLDDWHSGKIRRKNPKRVSSQSLRRPLEPVDGNSNRTPFPVYSDDQDESTHDSDIKNASNNGPPVRDSFKLSRGNRPRNSYYHIDRRQRHRNLQSLQDGQLEAEESSTRSPQDRLRFHQILQQENQDYTISRKAGAQQLPRTLSELEAQINRMAVKSHGQQPANEDQRAVKERTIRRRRMRKLRPHQVDVEIAAYRQPVEIILPSRLPSSVQLPIVEESEDVLHDLNTWGMPYSQDFDIFPLPVGTYFHASTFVGSCSFKNALSLVDRNLDDNSEASHIVTIAGEQYMWGAWSEQMSSAGQDLLGRVARSLNGTTDELARPRQTAIDLDSCVRVLEVILEANGQWLVFSDPIDRVAFGQTYLDVLEELATAFEVRASKSDGTHDQLLRIASRLSTLIGQVYLVLQGHDACDKLQQLSGLLLQRHLASFADFLLRHGSGEIRSFYDDNRRHAIREGGIKTGYPSVEAVVVLHHVISKTEMPGFSVWDVFNAQLLVAIDTTRRTGVFEHCWLSIFTILPLLEIGLDGVHQSGRRFQAAFDNWEAIKRLVSRALVLYRETTKVPGTTVNDYVRTLLIRCHRLAHSWAWRRCEAIISVFFDFFAKRNYMSLCKEENFGSPNFLQNLALQPSIDINEGEKAFHIFLKFIAVGLHGMRTVYSDKQIRSIVWRWLPNHSHTYDKDKELREEDLDALRNQHDLLSTLYWAAPSSARPRLQLVQNLVEHSTSHLEACRISIKTWSNLAAFQLSTTEPVATTKSIAAWLKEILEQSVAQFKEARPELEAQLESARRSGIAVITTERLDLMILRNQAGIVAALTDAIVGLRTAFKTASSIEMAWTILHECNIPAVLSLFDSKNKKTNPILLDALKMFEEFLALLVRCESSKGSQNAGEESQDYGDWPEENDVAEELGSNHEPLTFVLEHVAHLLSTVFGSESTPTDEVLVKTTEHWALLASIAIRHKVASADTFLGDYGKHSWSQLRSTPQQRKLYPYFLSHLLRHDRSVFANHRDIFFSVWLRSLVERDAQLKFQHVLTSDLLNNCSDEAILQNLPFTERPSDKNYLISVNDIRERRLALLSRVLSNMRNEYQRRMETNPASLRVLRAEYASLLNHMMLQMRRNYEELRQGEGVIGAYVAFVQAMVEFMQQYTTEICPIDQFFTDSSAFPLPVGDPTYLVGRLRGYDGKLHDARSVKQLIIFMQNVSERAAVDNEQQYLASQLNRLLCQQFGLSSLDKTTLRSTLLFIIFPAYIESSIDNSVARIFARPILQSVRELLGDILYNFSATNAHILSTITGVISALLYSMRMSISVLEDAADRILDPSIMSALSDIFSVTTACSPIVDYVRRRSGYGLQAVESLDSLKDFSLFVARVLMNERSAFPPVTLEDRQMRGAMAEEMRTFCSQQLQQYLKEKWRTDDGRYMVKRGVEWIEIQVELGTTSEEREKLMKAIVQFHTTADESVSL